MFKTCPFCGYRMDLIREYHDELDFPVYEKPYWECFECGCCLSVNYEEEEEGDLYYED